MPLISFLSSHMTCFATIMPNTTIHWLLHPSHITSSGKLYSTLEYGCTYKYFLYDILLHFFYLSLVLLPGGTSTQHKRDRITARHVTLTYDTNIRLQNANDEPRCPLVLCRSTQAYTILRVLHTLQVLKRQSLITRICAKSYVLLYKFELYGVFGF
jgi:hypothetical protein